MRSWLASQAAGPYPEPPPPPHQSHMHVTTMHPRLFLAHILPCPSHCAHTAPALAGHRTHLAGQLAAPPGGGHAPALLAHLLIPHADSWRGGHHPGPAHAGVVSGPPSPPALWAHAPRSRWAPPHRLHCGLTPQEAGGHPLTACTVPGTPHRLHCGLTPQEAGGHPLTACTVPGTPHRLHCGLTPQEAGGGRTCPTSCHSESGAVDTQCPYGSRPPRFKVMK